MVKIKLRRVGATKQPSYRLVVADSRSSRDGKFINIIGHYNPRTQPEELVIDEQQALDWLKQGAQPTATAARLLNKAGILDKFNDEQGETMRELLEYIVKAIVDAPDKVVITEETSEQGVTFKLAGC